jgi:hypothetical protein
VFLAGLFRGEVAVDEIRDGAGLAVLLGQRVPPGLRLAGLQAQLTHDLADRLVVDGLAAADQGGVNSPVPVPGVIRLEQRLDLYS